MQLRINRRTLLIIPETDQDTAFIEDSLGMKEDGDVIRFERIDDGTKNWVRFRLESYALCADAMDKNASSARVPKDRIDTDQFKDIGASNDGREQITLVDIEEVE